MIKYMDAKTETLRQVITLIDLFKDGCAMKRVISYADAMGFSIDVKTKAELRNELIKLYDFALNEEEAETLVVI